MQNLALSTIGFRHIDEISSSKNEPDWLKEYRKNSLSVYQKLPLETSPLYNKYTDANKMDPDQVSLTINSDKIVTEDNSKASIIQELYAPKTSHQQAYLELLNVSVGQNSQLDGTTLQIMDNSAVNFSTRKSNIAQDGKINWYLGLFGAMLSRYRIDYYLNGSGASVNDSEVVFGNDNQSFDLSSNVNHEKPSTEA